MGGYGSGRWGPGYQRKTAAEECRHLDVRKLRRSGLLQEGRTWRGMLTWTSMSGAQASSVALASSAAAVRLSYSLQAAGGAPERVSIEVPVVWTPLRFGGGQPWFLCPGPSCGRRVAKLYLPIYEGGTPRFLCRHCHDLSYRSRQTWDKKSAYLWKHPEAVLATLQDPEARPAERLAALKAAVRGL